MTDELMPEHAEYFRQIFHDFDINGDGRLTQADVNEIAQRAVTL